MRELVCGESVERVGCDLLRRVVGDLIEMRDRVIHALIFKEAIAMRISTGSGAL